MSVTLTINGSTTEMDADASIFDCAERIGVQVPTSCHKNGKCKECMVEITQGMELLSPRTQAEDHLKDAFRLSCQTRTIASDGEVKCHTMRRAAMRIERHALGLPLRGNFRIDPAVTRDGDRILLDGVEIDRFSGPVHGIAMDLGTTTI